MTRKTEGIDDKTRQRALFYLEQMLAALSPSNFALTNPEVLRATFETNAANLVQGMAHLAADLEQSKDLLRISQTDLSAFEVGRNLAVTPGKVVFQNDLMQLIQYEPSTPKVAKRPLLVIPPWINKYYILDLREKNSFIRWAVQQGHTVLGVATGKPVSLGGSLGRATATSRAACTASTLPWLRPASKSVQVPWGLKVQAVDPLPISRDSWLLARPAEALSVMRGKNAARAAPILALAASSNCSA